MQGFFDFVKSLGAARMAAMAAVTLALIGFFSFLMIRMTTPQMVPLFTDLSVEDSASIVKDLERQAIAYQIKNDGAIVMVAKDNVARLRMKLAEGGLPKGGGVGYEIFDKSDALGSTTFVQNINHLRALEGELARTIRGLDRVQAARVHLVLPDRPLFSRDKIETSASIVLKVRGTLEPQQVRAIRHLVATAVSGLKPERVSVIDETGKLLADGAAQSDPQEGAGADERKATYEKRLREQVEAIVSSVVGPGHARVEITADFDLNRITQTSDKFDPDGRVQRAKKPFITVNCAAIPENLLESELFGHEKGAFTGALGRRIGKSEEANGGTLLLDEISEMDVRLQAKLLRAIQERLIDRVGGGKPVPVDIRIVATSNRNLTDAVREGKFREDLWFRLNVVNLKIPPLRERPSDITELAQYFAKKYSDANGLPVRPLSAEARRALNINRWPGNVRELENTLHRAVLLSSGPEIGIDGILSPDGLRLDQSRGSGAVAHAAMAAEQVTRNLVGRTVAEVERDLILETLKHCLGNRTHAANILGISIRTLRNKLNEYAADGAPIPPPNGGEMRGAA